MGVDACVGVFCVVVFGAHSSGCKPNDPKDLLMIFDE